MQVSPRVVPVMLALGLLLVPLAAEAQPAQRVYRVGYLATGQMRVSIWEAFLSGLREHGYVEGRNLAFEFRRAEGEVARLPALAKELVGLPVDVLVVGTGHAALAAKAASRTTPVVFVDVGNPVGKGLVASLARPGGNLTGLAWDAGPELVAKWLEHVREAVPGASRVATLTDEPPDPGFRAALESAARQLKLTLHRFYARRPEDFAVAFAAIEQARVDALYWCLSSPDKPALDFVARHRLPSAACWREPVAAGALMSYAPSTTDQWRRAAGYIDKILKGAKPADLPVEQPRKFELVINMKTAKALGLTIPSSLRVRADELIE